MPTAKLTDGLVEGYTVGEREVFVWDTALPRFGVRVTPTGARIYLIQYRAKAAPGEKSKTRKITIGQHDGELWNVTKARAAARKLLAPVDLGDDPFAEREAKRTAEAAARAADAEVEALKAREAEARARDSFEAVADRYIALCLKASRSGAETARLLRHGPVPAWRGRHIAEVRRSDLADLIDTIKQRSPAVARATYAALRGLFSWCVERDLIVASPCQSITAPPRPEARDRVLADNELAVIWNASDALGYPFGQVVKLLMLTGQRRAEVANMAWAEIDLDTGTWRIPKERAKNGKAHEIDLSPQTVEVLNSVKRNGPYLFPARKAPTRKAVQARAEATAESQGVRGFSAVKRKLDGEAETLWQAALAKAKAKHVAPMEPWRIHDLRRSAATGMAAMGFAPHVVERVLNHISGTQSGLVGVYQRHEYRAERKAAMLAWGAHVEAVAKGEALPSNVRPLRQA
jgi:integrase